MLDLVFPTNNDASIRSKWSATASGGIEAAKGRLGICASMTAFWIKRSKELGVDKVTSFGHIGSEHRMAITQGAYGFLNRKAGERCFWVLDTLGLSHSAFEQGGDCVASLLATELTRQNGFVFFGVGAPGRGAHAMGAHVGTGSYYFFDPNFGLFHGSRRIDFVTHLGRELDSTYGEILDGWYRCSVN